MKQAARNLAFAAPILAAAALTGAVHVGACGPEFPNRLLLGGESTLLEAPKAPEFEERIAHLAESAGVTFKAVVPEDGDYETQTADAKRTDPAKAVGEGGPRDGMPVEFEYYEQGAQAYRRTRYDDAIAQWRRVLELPADARTYRSTWAAFMIGKAMQQQQKYAASIPWFEKTRSLAQAGCVDSLGLAASSYGWQGYSAWHMEHYDEALELYVAHLATGDPTAKDSLLHTARRLLDANDENAFNAAANSPVARQVVTAYLLTKFNPWDLWAQRAHSWARAVDHTGAAAFDEAGRIAVIAYQGGDMDLAQRYASLAQPEDVLAGWIRAKLLLRYGRVAEAADILATLARKLPRAKDDPAQPKYVEGWFYNRTGMNLQTDPVASHVQAEFAILRLSQRQFIEALNALLLGGHWIDAAYVAEYVLTADELKTYVDRAWPVVEPSHDTSRWMRRQIRHLLARRLTRIGRCQEARPYFPAEWQPRLDSYIQAIREGHNEKFPKDYRGRRLFEAAQRARHQGMDLLGTEVEPDWRVYAGDFQDDPATALRQYDYAGKLALPSKEEFQRTAQHFPEPNVRWHYRYTAIDHAWQAATLMPDNDDETARMLCIAGSWIKAKDPHGADRFYKALVQRCGKTALGAEADKLRWFPKVAENFGDTSK